MKKHLTRINVFLIGLMLALSFPLYAEQVNDTIIAVVNNEVITLKDLHDYLSAIYVQLASKGKDETEIKDMMSKYEKDGINRLIEDKLLVSEANRQEMQIRSKVIDDKMEQLKKSYPTEAEFLKALVKEGLTVTELRKRITDQFKAQYIIEMEVKSKIFVNPNEVTEYYEKHTSDFNKPEKVDLDSIFIPYDDKGIKTPKSPSDKTQNTAITRTPDQKVAEIKNLLKTGLDFNVIANQFSSSPSVGTIEKGQMLPVIENAVFNLKEGEISQPLKTDNGIFIFKLKKKYPAEASSLEEVKDKIYNFLFNQKFQTRLNTWLEELKKKTYIEIKN